MYSSDWSDWSDFVISRICNSKNDILCEIAQEYRETAGNGPGIARESDERKSADTLVSATI